ncbi:MAG: histidinol dehydrogenase, partial [Proteobacteria bacterium]|nr:histidinol dehydrogenase [Pseudomonadota bacterium]
MKPIAYYELDGLDNAERHRLLTRPENDIGEFIGKVRPIVEDVRIRGDTALIEYARKFDGAVFGIDEIGATKADIDAAFDRVDDALIETLEYAADNIRRYHRAQMPEEMWIKEIRPGVFAGERHTPIDSAAIYSPRGKGSFPSTVLMGAIPAVVAGVSDPVVLTPAGPDGEIDPATLVAARLAGVERVFKAGGAAAVAAAAFGTERIPKCLKIEGPGGPWLLAAKRVLSAHISCRLPAGPSDVLVFADDTANAGLAALDLLIESEHGTDSSAFLVTTSRNLAHEAIARIPELWKRMGKTWVEHSSAVLCGENGGVIHSASLQSAYDFINDYAPEHLQVLSETPFDHLRHIRNAAEVLLGNYSPGSIANYVMGPNCVLPTGGHAKTHAPLGVYDFVKRGTVAHVTREGYDEMAAHTNRFARYEGFDGHANAVSEARQEMLS